MVGSIVLVLLGAAAAATPCESLVGLKLDKATITAATMVPEGPRTGPRRRSSARWRCCGRAGRPGTSAGDDSRALPRADRAEALVRLADQHGDVAAARRAVERQVHGGRQWRVRRIDSGSDERDAAGAASRLRHRGHRHRTPGSGRRVGHRPPGEDDRLRLPRHPRDDAQEQGARQGVLRSRRAVLVLQGMLDRRTHGRDGGAAVSGRLRRHHRRLARQPPHPHVDGRHRAQHRPVAPSRRRPSPRSRRRSSTTW